MTKKEQMNKFQKYATIGIFIALVFVPGVAWVFCGGTIGDDNSENRKLAEMPAFDITKIDKFPKQFDEYYNDHAPFRRVIKDAWTGLNYTALGDSTTENVVVGKNNGSSGSEAWLFYSKSSDNNPVASVQGIVEHSDDIVKKIDSSIKSTTDELRKKGIDYYFFIAPNKENIYREYLPDNVAIFGEKSKDEKLIDRLKISNKNIIYGKEEIMNAKDVGQLYYKQDTHWNNLGAFYGFKALMQSIEPEFKDYEYKLEYTEPKVHNRDLARFLGMRNYFTDVDAIIRYREKSTVQISAESEGDKEVKISVNDKPAVDKTLMVIGDSYRSAMLPYLQKVYRKVVSVSRAGGYEKPFIEKYQPDVVIMEAVERYAMSGGKFKVL